jgi:mono/diheme cytochrome c family protein
MNSLSRSASALAPVAVLRVALLPVALLPVALLLGGALMAAGCGPQRRGEPITEPLDPKDPRIVLGHRVFSQHCHQCHPGGAAGLGPAINDKPLPVTAIKAQVRQGHFLMPKFSQQEVSDEELDAVVRYLKALRSLDEVASG